MDGWMDGWTDGRMDGWTDGRMDGRTDGRTDGWMDGNMFTDVKQIFESPIQVVNFCNKCLYSAL